MDKLKQRISSIDFNEPYNDGHRAIYSSVHLPLPLDLPLTYLLTDHLQTLRLGAVPPSLVFYTAHNILSPSFILGQIPDLLNLLTSVETFRRFAALKSDEALGLQKYYECEKAAGRAEGVRLLPPNEVHVLRRFVGEKDTQRRGYITLVRSLIPLVSGSHCI